MPKLLKLSSVMEDQCWTQEGLAAKAKLSTRTIWTAQKGQSVSAVTARAICKAVGLKIEELR